MVFLDRHGTIISLCPFIAVLPTLTKVAFRNTKKFVRLLWVGNTDFYLVSRGQPPLFSVNNNAAQTRHSFLNKSLLFLFCAKNPDLRKVTFRTIIFSGVCH